MNNRDGLSRALTALPLVVVVVVMLSVVVVVVVAVVVVAVLSVVAVLTSELADVRAYGREYNPDPLSSKNNPRQSANG